MNGQLFIITAPSGAGKTSLVAQLLAADPAIALSVSHTTRPAREGEIDGQHYHFTDRAHFEAMVAAGEFLEHADVFGNYYGTSHAAAQAVLDTGKDVILEIDWQGARQVRDNPAAAPCSIFILPPTRATLLERLQKRGSDSPEVIARRTAEAIEEMSHCFDADYLIINDHFDTALAELRTVILAERLRQPRASQTHRVQIEALLAPAD